MANEKRLIDANALKKAIRAESWKQETMIQLAIDYIDIIIDEQPSVDAVEVVECRDCKHFEKMKSNNSFFCNEYGGAVKENDYCSRAEPLRNKKMDGGNEDG